MATKKKPAPKKPAAKPAAPKPKDAPDLGAQVAGQAQTEKRMIAHRMEMLMTHSNPDRPVHCVENELVEFIRFIGRKYGVAIRHAVYSRKGHEETVNIGLVVTRMPDGRAEENTWTHGDDMKIALAT
jgi:hypothetical protein